MATTTSATRDFTVAVGNWRRCPRSSGGIKFAAVIALAEPVILVFALVALRMLLKPAEA